MAEQQDTGEKSEKATPHKLRQSRLQGQVPRSRDWATVVGILVSLQLLVLLTPGYLEDFRVLFRQGFAALDGDGALDNVWSNTFSATMMLGFKLVLPLAAIPVFIIIGGLFPGGWLFAPTHLKPKLERLNPFGYLKRLFKPRHAAAVISSILKAALLIVVLYQVSTRGVGEFLHLQSLALPDALSHGTGLMVRGVLWLCAVMLLFGLIDLPVQALVFLREQRMSKRDLKEEMKSTEGRPEVRQRVRQLQHQMARGGIRRTVPEADVVIANPTHFAVALKYDSTRAEAPFVVAKGVDESAQYIRQVALEHGVEVLTLPPLARAIYNTSQVNQQIPAMLYKAVAQVLTYVLQLQAFREGRRDRQPAPPDDLAIPPHLT